MNSTDIGYGLQHARVLELGCAAGPSFGTGVLGGVIGAALCPVCALVGFVGGANLGLYGEGHSCPFRDEDALGAIATIANSENPAYIEKVPGLR